MSVKQTSERKDKAAQSPEEQAAVARWKQLTEHILPAHAREQHWPIRLDHCFKRICLDHAFGDVWYAHLPKPAERHLRGAPLARAVACAEALAAGDRPLLDRRNAESLRYRGKTPRGDAGHETYLPEKR